MAEREHRRGVLESAGRTAFALLRQTRKRAKIGTLHLPIALHPSRQQTIVLPHSAPVSTPREPAGTPRTPLDETRALRSRLAMTERRVARLRQALERERQARRQALAAIQEPRGLIEQLVAEIEASDRQDTTALRTAITAVLDAYGFRVQKDEQREPPARTSGASSIPPAIPGWDRQRVQALTARVLEQQPEIGAARYIQLSMQMLATHGALTPAQLASRAELTSPIARRRLRLTLEALCANGVLKKDGPRFVLAPPRA